MKFILLLLLLPTMAFASKESNWIKIQDKPDIVLIDEASIVLTPQKDIIDAWTYSANVKVIYDDGIELTSWLVTCDIGQGFMRIISRDAILNTGGKMRINLIPKAAEVKSGSINSLIYEHTCNRVFNDLIEENKNAR